MSKVHERAILHLELRSDTLAKLGKLIELRDRAFVGWMGIQVQIQLHQHKIDGLQIMQQLVKRIIELLGH